MAITFDNGQVLIDGQALPAETAKEIVTNIGVICKGLNAIEYEIKSEIEQALNNLNAITADIDDGPMAVFEAMRKSAASGLNSRFGGHKKLTIQDIGHNYFSGLYALNLCKTQFDPATNTNFSEAADTAVTRGI